MRCYSITESELRTIGLANVGQNIFLSVGSALVAFSLDIFKDTTMAEHVPTMAAEIASYAQPICLFLGLACYVAAFAVWRWRRGMIDTIKKESSDVAQPQP
jgi:hypothetical protein